MSAGDRAAPRIALLWWASALLAVLAIALALSAEAVHRSDTIGQAEAQADVLAGSVSAALAFEDEAAMRQYLEALMRNPRVAAAAIYGPTGRRLALLARSDAAPAPAAVDQPATHWMRGRAVVARPATEQGDRLGYVYIQSEPDTLASIATRHGPMILLTLLALVLLWAITRAAADLDRVNRRLTKEIRARGAAEEALRQSQKLEALGQLTGGIAHDFNNLLQAIGGAFDLIQARAGDERTVRRWAQNGLAAAERGATLTRQLLAFSRQQKLETVAVVVAPLLLAMRDLLARTLGPAIDLSFSIEADDAAVMSDATQLELAVMNLVVNARDAMDGDGRLTVRLRRVEINLDALLPSGRYLELQVSDTGAGMTLDVMRRAFDPFFTTKAVGKGTGLGLAQVYGLARQAGGDARIVSAPGEGATVSLLLPEAAAPLLAPGPPARSRVDGPSRSANILLVDDDDAVRGVVRGGLEARGFAVMEAESGEAALRIAESTAPEIAVIDYAMPGMNGAETAERLRAARPDLPIILASGHADTAAIERALGGRGVVLRKPFEIGALADAVTRSLADAPRP